MKPRILYASHRAGGAMVTFGFACSRCGTAFGVQAAELEFKQTKVAAERCCTDREAPSSSRPVADAELDEWIDVLDELPPERVRVLIIDPTAPDGFYIAQRVGQSFYVDNRSRRWAPTFWRALVAP